MSKSTLKAEAVATVTRLKERGLAFVEETRVATTSLLTDTRDAGERFVGTTREEHEPASRVICRSSIRVWNAAALKRHPGWPILTPTS